VLDLAGVSGGSEVDVQFPLHINPEGMHRMVAGQGQARHDDLGATVGAIIPDGKA
jgi:hypothetical protein